MIGSDPQKYGLCQSLLERLYSMYASHPSTNTENCCATLLKNYRCHPSLLALVSYLFYRSTLTTSIAAKKQTPLHPNTTSSLYFICSSLDDLIVQVNDSVNNEEALLLLQTAAEYIKEWPPEWGRKDLSTVCFITTTASQVGTLLYKACKIISN